MPDPTSVPDPSSVATAAPRLTSLSHGAGCACKLSLDELTSILDGVVWPQHPDLLVGVGTGDDAAVWRQDDGRALVATTDFFTPLVDDPRDWGRIAATNAVSDVYAMGATPRFALNLVGWPRDLPFALLREVLDGAAEVARDAGYPIAGGHSIDAVEPLFGQVVLGDVPIDDLLRNDAAHPGQALVLTKPIGTGIVTTALKRSAPLSEVDDPVLAGAYAAAVASMTQLNRQAAATAHEVAATAATDVTGFGLLGHAHRMARASGVTFELDPSAVPLLDGVEQLLAAGFVPGGTTRNAEQAGAFVDGDHTPDELLLLADAQTSGGLLLACDPDAASQAVADLTATGHRAAIVGRVSDGPAGRIRIRAS